jgi:hypothetical protein
MPTLDDIFKNQCGDTQKLDNPPLKVVFRHLNPKKKVTKSGIKVELKHKTVTVTYSKNYKVMLTFSSKKEAIKEYNKHHKSHKDI